MKTRVARCGHEVPVHPGKQRRACDDCLAAIGMAAQTCQITCAGCEKHVQVGSSRQRYCTKPCQIATNARKKSERLALVRASSQKTCKGCGDSLVGRRPDVLWCSRRCHDVARGQRLPERLAPRQCALPECMAEFQPKMTKQRCCSEKHGKLLCHRERRADGREKTPEWDDARRDHYHRRRALKRQASTGEPVRLAEIRERDRNCCHLCGKRVSDKPWPHPLSPSLDHVVPLTKGGSHDPANVKLAHLRCNTAKGNRGGGEQLLLIG